MSRLPGLTFERIATMTTEDMLAALLAYALANRLPETSILSAIARRAATNPDVRGERYRWSAAAPGIGIRNPFETERHDDAVEVEMAADDGERIQGTVEWVPGTCGVVWFRNPDGTIGCEYDGDGTKMFWDGALSRHAPDGETLWLTAGDGKEVRLSALHVVEPEATP